MISASLVIALCALSFLLGQFSMAIWNRLAPPEDRPRPIRHPSPVEIREYARRLAIAARHQKN